MYRMQNVDGWIDYEARSDLNWLERAAPIADVIVTHIQPSIRAISSQYIGSRDNWYFCLELDSLIEQTKPPLWIAGHTHDAWDGRIGSTRLVINPRGYPRETRAQRNFRPGLVVEALRRTE